MSLTKLAPGLLRWSAPHPNWGPGRGWEREVACYVVAAGDATLLVDPLADDFGEIDAVVEQRRLPVAILLSRAGHFRSSQEAADRYEAVVYGHERARPRLARGTYEAVGPEDILPGGARVLDYEPQYDGTPLYFPTHRAVAVGDLLVTPGGVLRLWWASDGEEDEREYREVFVPSIRRWLELPVEHVLVAHGEQVAGGGSELERAIERPPWSVV